MSYHAQKLQTLVDHAMKVNDRHFDPPPADRAGEMDPTLAKAWGKFLLSIATTESIEESLISPLHKIFEKNELAQKCIHFHAIDERRHFSAFTDYVSRTFDLRKTKRSHSDVVVYDTILPKITSALSRSPACLIGILYFYEIFSVDFYKTLKEKATDCSLPHLVSLIQTIEKDELRHLACLETLMAHLEPRSKVKKIADRLILKSILSLLMIDIETSSWAIHNRRVRETVLRIGLSPIEMSQSAKKAAKKATRLIGAS
jgi:rubrerythrin